MTQPTVIPLMKAFIGWSPKHAATTFTLSQQVCKCVSVRVESSEDVSMCVRPCKCVVQVIVTQRNLKDGCTMIHLGF